MSTHQSPTHCMVQCQLQSPPCPASRAQRAVESRGLHHLNDGPHALAGLAHHLGPGVAVLDLAGGVGPIRQLVLESHHVESRVARTVRQPARHDEARRSVVLFGLG